MRIPRLVLTAALVLSLAACGQKGPLYQTDEGITVAPGSPAPAPSGPTGAPAPATDTESGAVVPATPDRSDEPRKRIHTP